MKSLTRLSLSFAIPIAIFLGALGFALTFNSSPKLLSANTISHTLITDEIDELPDGSIIGRYDDGYYSTDPESGTQTRIGWHYQPRAINVINDEYFVIADRTCVKLMTHNDEYVADFKFPGNNFLIASITFDLWKNIYLTPSNPTNPSLHYEFENGKLTYRGTIETTQIPNVPLTDSCGQTITEWPTPIDTITAPKRSFCRATGQIFYINPATNTHNIISNETMPDYLNVLASSTTQIDWQNLRLEYQSTRSNLFMVTAPNKTTVLYDFPNFIRPNIVLPKNHSLQIAVKNSYLFHTITVPSTSTSQTAPFTNFSMVIYQNKRYYCDFTTLSSTPFASTDLGFSHDNQPQTFYAGLGRVLVHNLLIYRYPSANPLAAYEWKLPRNFALAGNNTATPGLQLVRKITIPDAKGRYFYEIRLDATGHPVNFSNNSLNLEESGHLFVGYVDTSFVMDSYKSIRSYKYTTNATIKLPNALKDAGLPVYTSPQGYSQNLLGESLHDGDRIRVIGKKQNGFIQISFYNYDFENNTEYYHESWVDARYVVADGVNPWQIVAIVALFLVGVTIIYITIRHFRARHSTEVI